MQRRPRNRRLVKKLWVAETVACLLAARLALAFLPFRRIVGAVSRPSRKRQVLDRERRLARLTVKRLIFSAYRRFPGTTCFQRALAAHFMLRRRGVNTTLYYGATSLSERGLTGHVWLQDGAEFVVGRSAAKDHHPLASFPGDPTGMH
jgi:hypothetical protein